MKRLLVSAFNNVSWFTVGGMIGLTFVTLFMMFVLFIV